MDVIVRLPHPRSGDSQGQETFLAPSADKQTRIYKYIYKNINRNIYVYICIYIYIYIYIVCTVNIFSVYVYIYTENINTERHFQNFRK